MINLHNPHLAFAVFTAWLHRQHMPSDLPAGRLTLVIMRHELPLAKRMIDAGKKALAKQCHPDRGGDPQEMVRLNVLADSLSTQSTLLEDAR